MSSFGEGIQITPLELGSVVATIANGGTQYYLQYPRTPEARDAFEPRVKNQLAIESLLPEVRDGMLAAVLYGTAQRSWDYVGEQPLGKTGSCSDSTSRIGWFASYADELHPRIVLVVLMRGHNHVVQGPTAAEIACTKRIISPRTSPVGNRSLRRRPLQIPPPQPARSSPKVLLQHKSPAPILSPTLRSVSPFAVAARRNFSFLRFA
jgi:membrane peptidoglycan carboxypeptidase